MTTSSSRESTISSPLVCPFTWSPTPAQVHVPVQYALDDGSGVSDYQFNVYAREYLSEATNQ